MSIEGLAAARLEREAAAAALDAKKARLARRIAIVRALILYPCLIVALALIWYAGVLYGTL
jgi:hypothetical protein